jgi:hypothetical protein
MRSPGLAVNPLSLGLSFSSPSGVVCDSKLIIDLQILFKSNSTPDVKRDQLGTHPTEVLTRSQATWQLLLAQTIEFTSVS